MMRLRIVKYAMDEAQKEDYEDNLPYGTKVLKELLMPWANTYSIICADSYFASVPDTK